MSRIAIAYTGRLVMPTRDIIHEAVKNALIKQYLRQNSDEAGRLSSV